MGVEVPVKSRARDTPPSRLKMWQIFWCNSYWTINRAAHSITWRRRRATGYLQSCTHDSRL